MVTKVKPLEQRALLAWAPSKDEPEDVELDPLFIGLVFKLPAMGSQWSQEQRDAWLMMFNAVADGLHPESVPPDDDGDDEAQPESATDAGDDVTSAAAEDIFAFADAGVEDAGGAEDPPPPPTRKFHTESPYKDTCEAGGSVMDVIKRAGKPGCVWYNKLTGRIRVCAADYKGDDDEILVGTYGPRMSSRLIADLKEVRDQLGHEAITGVDL